jgi:hypothetical protein
MLTLWFATGIICAQQTGTEEPEQPLGGAWLPIIYVRDKKKLPEIEQAVEIAVAAEIAKEPEITPSLIREIARTVARRYDDAGLRLKELEQFARAVEARLIAERIKRNNDTIAILLMAT